VTSTTTSPVSLLSISSSEPKETTMIQHRVRRLSSLLAVPAAFAIFALAGQQPIQGDTQSAPIKGKILCTTSSSQSCGPLAG
jgi:hypothetical protein